MGDDATADDIPFAASVDPTALNLRSRQPDRDRAEENFVDANATAGETISAIGLVQSSGAEFSTTVGVPSGISTTAGEPILLFLDPANVNVIFGKTAGRPLHSQSLGSTDPADAGGPTSPVRAYPASD